MRRFLLINILLLASLVACAKKRPSASSNDVFIIPASSPQNAQQIADAAKVVCQNKSCPSEVGMLVSVQLPDAGSSGVALCTAFAISPTRFLTNSHCLSPHLRKPMADVNAGEVRIFFPETNLLPASSIQIDKVIFASSLGNMVRTRDYAILESKQSTQRPSLKISQDGVENLAPLKAIKIDPTSSFAASGELTEDRCTNIHRSLLLPTAASKLSPILGLGDCNIIGGNSGSPLIDEQGQVKAIIQARLQMPEEKKKNVLASVGMEKLPAFAVATNFACVSLKGENLPLDCLMQADRWEQGKTSISEQLLSDDELNQFHFKWKTRATEWGRDNSNWEIRRFKSGKTSGFALIPACFSAQQMEVKGPTSLFWLDLSFNHYLQASGASTEDKADFLISSEGEIQVFQNQSLLFSDQLLPCPSQP